jgi:hypothetical protein
VHYHGRQEARATFCPIAAVTIMCRSMCSAMCLAGYDGSNRAFGVPSAARPRVPSCVLNEHVSCEGKGLTSVCGCEMITFK